MLVLKFFRLNFSHGSWKIIKSAFDAVREVENEAGRPLAIIMDIQAKNCRVGTFAKGAVNLVDGANFQLDLEKPPAMKPRKYAASRNLSSGATARYFVS